MSKKIAGKVVHKNIGPGCWGIISDDKEYRIVDMPEQLKYEGATVHVKIQAVDEGASIFMWGEPVEVISFKTLMP